ncbi:bifunctional diguanylate cyclase/phosphodiesterase [Williamsia sp. CHRR-6]|uniref:sensor domain-containing protein n=1 Tax=Williamsia sp. CHRR-6 TaxID=2835871 RepID=UPI001BD9D965|nr:PAS domain S-box protein [Williamsia sp. CHRR-6]MBT0567042.1 PAS domain S-box protein [Williamsia sp. CHRR-6]
MSARWSQDALVAALIDVRGSLPDDDHVITVQDEAGTIVASSHTVKQLLGLSYEELLGRNAHEPLWAAIDTDGQSLRGADHPPMRAVRAGEPVTDEVIGIFGRVADVGGYIWLRIDSFPLPEPLRERGGAVITCATELAGPEADRLRLTQSERMFRGIADRAQEAMGLHSLDGTWLWASPASASVLGHDPADLFSTNVFDIIHPEDVAMAQARLADLMRGSGPLTVGIRMVRPDGSTLWAEVIGQLIRDQNGDPYQLQSSFRDITGRVDAERARDAALGVFESVMASSPIGMALCDLDGTVRTTNNALHEILRCSAGDLIGHTLVDQIDTEQRERVAEQRHAIVTGRTANARYEARFRFGSHVFWGESTVVVLRDADGTPSGVLEQVTDVSARRNAHAELERRATSDPLTGLPNRARLLHDLEAALENARSTGEKVGVLFIDVDRFKSVNDTWGHSVGDEVLRTVADRLTTSVMGRGSVIRFGGDEFVVVCQGRIDAVTAAFGAVRRAMSRPFISESGTDLAVTVSVGEALGATRPAEDLLREADRTMYLAKHGRDRPGL